MVLLLLLSCFVDSVEFDELFVVLQEFEVVVLVILQAKTVELDWELLLLLLF